MKKLNINKQTKNRLHWKVTLKYFFNLFEMNDSIGVSHDRFGILSFLINKKLL